MVRMPTHKKLLINRTALRSELDKLDDGADVDSIYSDLEIELNDKDLEIE